MLGTFTLPASLVTSLSGTGPDACETTQNLPRRGIELADLTWEFEQHAPLNVFPHDSFEYVIAEGIVTARVPRESAIEDWTLRNSCYPAWTETTIEVQKTVAVNCVVETAPGEWTFVERHGHFRDDKGNVFETYWARGTERYNRLRVGDRIILAGVRTRECKDSCFYYSPDFCPHFSIVFNVVVRDGMVCVDKPWRSISDGFWIGDRLANAVSSSEAIPREEHRYSVYPDEAFEAIVEAVRERA